MLPFSADALHKTNIAALRINNLARVRNQTSTYLEIGVQHGETFFNVDMEHKFAVDPCFLFDSAIYKNEKNLHFFDMTSDNFFEMLSNSKSRKVKFDIIFIDGLHTFEQSLRDFQNSLRIAHDNTIWIIDDTVPTNPFSWFTDRNITNRLLERTRFAPRPWHGDVFKTIFAIHDMFTGFDYCTLMWKSQTVLWKLKTPSNRKARFGTVGDIDKLTYFDMLTHGDVFHPIPEHLLLSVVGTDLSGMTYPPNIGDYFVYPMDGRDFTSPAS